MHDDFDTLVAALESAGCTMRGNAVVCGFHPDRNASGSVHQGADGRWRYTCHGGTCGVSGDAADIIARTTGRSLAEILKEHKTMTTSTEPRRVEKEVRRWPTYEAAVADLKAWPSTVELYTYRDAAGHPVLIVQRMNPKAFPQASPAPGGGWWYRGITGTQPLYNLPSIIGAEVVIVNEGEKDVNHLALLGIVATTAPMGADAITVSLDDEGKPGKADWSPVAGKRVVLWGDDDEPGRRHMERVARIVGKLHPRPALYRVRKEDLHGAKDAAELIAGAGSDEAARIAVQRVLDNAVPIRASAALYERVEAAIAGKFVAVPFPWASLSGMSAALLPGATTLLPGPPGATKSFLLLQAALWWLANGWRVAMYQLEEDTGFWLNRALALVAEYGGMTDPAWLAAHPDLARTMMARYAVELDRIAAAITTAPAAGITLDGLAVWIEAQAKAGMRIIVCDPITAAMEGSDKPWTAAQAFMVRVNHTAKTYGASVILASHGRKGDSRGGKSAPDLDSLAGGAAYARFSSSVLWLEAIPEPEVVTVIDADGQERHAKINRRIRILKARNGHGAGMTVGMHFSGSTLLTTEAGVIVNTDAQARRASAPKARSSRTSMASAPRADEDVMS